MKLRQLAYCLFRQLYYLPLLENSILYLPRRPGFELARVGNQLAQPALGQAEIPREPHGRAGLAANDANLNFEAGRQLPPFDKGGRSSLFLMRIDHAELADVAPRGEARLAVHPVLYFVHVIIPVDAGARTDDHDLAAGHGSGFAMTCH
jgi:hypothetical protein